MLNSAALRRPASVMRNRRRVANRRHANTGVIDRADRRFLVAVQPRLGERVVQVRADLPRGTRGGERVTATALGLEEFLPVLLVPRARKTARAARRQQKGDSHPSCGG